MEQYRAPASELGVGELIYRPKRGVFYSLIFAVVGVLLTSMILATIFAVFMDGDLNDAEALYTKLTNNYLFLFLDLAIDLLVLFLAGRILAKRVPGKESKYSLGVTIAILAIFSFMAISGEETERFPMWYNVITYVVR